MLSKEEFVGKTYGEDGLPHHAIAYITWVTCPKCGARRIEMNGMGDAFCNECLWCGSCYDVVHDPVMDAPLISEKPKIFERMAGWLASFRRS